MGNGKPVGVSSVGGMTDNHTQDVWVPRSLGTCPTDERRDKGTWVARPDVVLAVSWVLPIMWGV